MKLFTKDNLGTSFFKLGSDRNVCALRLIKSKDVFCFSNNVSIVRLRVQGFRSLVNTVFQKEKFVNSETMIKQSYLQWFVSARTNLVQKLF